MPGAAKRRLRRALPDAETSDTILLLKHVTELHLTEQIKLLTYAAMKSKKMLEIRIPADTVITPRLEAYIRQHGDEIRIDRDETTTVGP